MMNSVSHLLGVKAFARIGLKNALIVLFWCSADASDWRGAKDEILLNTMMCGLLDTAASNALSLCLHSTRQRTCAAQQCETRPPQKARMDRRGGAG